MEEPHATTTKKSVVIPHAIVIKDLATLLELPVTSIITELMKNGIMSSMNERIDYETAAVIAEDLGFTATLKEESEADRQKTSTEELNALLQEEAPGELSPRPPVVVVMGHVDHGKTKLLDAIRTTNVMEGESGGITQHIGAYQVEKKGRAITFIDTPGHEAFTAMRSRGAHVADIAILVVAADDGIKPQTKEAITIIQQADLPFLVAVNKIDKPDADLQKVQQQLAEANLLPEEWGGKVVTVPVSAKTGEGVDALLETILLIADIEKEHLLANPQRPAVGTVIEARIDKGEGPVATVVVKTGTLEQGQHVTIGSVVGKIKALKDWQGNIIATAGPSVPAKILGLKHAPEVGDVLKVVEAHEVRHIRRTQKVRTDRANTKVVYTTKREVQEGASPSKDQKEQLNVVLRCDNLGSQEAILETLQKYENTPVVVNVVAKGLGNITEADVLKADAAGALLFGFHVVATQRALEVAKDKQLDVKTFDVIYDLFDDVRQEVVARLPVETVETVFGKLRILAVFRREKRSMIVGGKVLDGRVRPGAMVRVLRDDVVVGTGSVGDVQHNKKRVPEVEKGLEAGIRFDGDPMLEEGDLLEFFTTEERRLSLDL